MKFERTKHAYVWIPNLKSERDGRLSLAWDGERLGWAWCSPKDQFNRRRGREMAEGRMRSNRGITFMEPLDSEQWFQSAFERVIPTSPGWVPPYVRDRDVKIEADTDGLAAYSASLLSMCRGEVLLLTDGMAAL